MKLFVDDIRKCPEGWHLARTVTEAIRCLATMEFEEVSLDHDIACYLVDGHQHTSNETFEPVARYLALLKKVDLAERERADEASGGRSEKIEWLVRITFHTSNFDAGRKMADILGVPYVVRWYPTDFIEGNCTCDKLPEDYEKPCSYCENYRQLTGAYPGLGEGA